MILTAYGHAAINYNGESIAVVPSFYNISKIGSPRAIVETVNSMREPVHISHTSAKKILQACCDKPLPLELFSCDFELSDNGHLIPNDYVGGAMINDLFVLASHCIKHGICGPSDDVNSADAEPLAEFDASEFIDLAVTHFKISYTEAANMTMTQFIRRMRAEYPEAHKKQQEEHQLIREQDELLRYARDKGLM